jgi:GDP-4-dehydro-6-deoxy-D-mannose reductase
MNKVMVTGAGGFIGKYLQRKLSSMGYEVIGIDSSSSNVADEISFLQYESAEIMHVFHLAAKSYVPDSWTNPSLFYRVNVQGTQNALEFCRRKKITMTYVSAYLYGIPEKLPISETDSVYPNNPYAHSKYLAEQLCEFYSREFHVNVTVIRPFNVYGAGQRDIFLIPTIINQVKHNDSIRVMDLLPRRDYIYIDDLIEALVLSMSGERGFSVYNIGSGVSISVKEIIDIVQKLFHTNKPVSDDGQVRKNEIQDVVADISRARAELAWSPQITFEDGVSRIIN